MKRLTRGELAKQSGVNFATVRYYEKLGLLPEPPRSNAGYRIFSTESVGRIRFIKQAQDLGFSLKEIKQLLDLRVTPEATSSDVRMRATEKITDIGDKIKRLREMKNSLEMLVESCCYDTAASECPILENLSSEDKF
ncbi:MAG: heavy metal-responsive transcriptional regulator [Pyrinomonadaceae bacterium]